MNLRVFCFILYQETPININLNVDHTESLGGKDF